MKELERKEKADDIKVKEGSAVSKFCVLPTCGPLHQLRGLQEICRCD